MNTESGGFALNRINRFAEILDRQSGNPGKQLVEKQVSGLYLGLQMQQIILDLQHNGLLDSNFTNNLSAKDISNLLVYNGSDKQLLTLKNASTRLRDRSAQLAGIIIGTIITTFPDIFSTDVIDIPIEGSLFWHMPGYKDIVTNVIQRLSGKDIYFPNIENAGRLGAAVAALSLKR